MRDAFTSAAVPRANSSSKSGFVVGVDYDNLQFRSFLYDFRLRYLPPPPQGNFEPLSVSRSGSVQAGVITNNGSSVPAVSIAGLGYLLPQIPVGSSGFASAVSSDGLTVSGTLQTAQGSQQAFAWSRAAGTWILGDTTFLSCRTTSVSKDGSVIYGVGETSQGQICWRWTRSTGIELVSSYLQRMRIRLLPQQLDSILDQTPDQDFLVGSARVGQGSGLKIALPPPDCIFIQSYSVGKGTQISNDTLSSVEFVDTDAVRVLSDQSGGIQVTLVGTSPTANPSHLGFEIHDAVSRKGIVQTVRVQSGSSPIYYYLGSQIATTATSAKVYFAQNPGQYVGPTRLVRVRVDWSPVNDEDPSGDGWEMQLNVARLRIE